MHDSKIIFLLNESCRAIEVAYEVDSLGRPTSKSIVKTLDPDVAVGDFVVVETDTRVNFTVVQVTAVDVAINLEDGQKCRWLYTRIDGEAFKQLKAEEAVAIAKVHETKRDAKRKKLREEMLAANPELAGVMQLAAPSEDTIESVE